MGDFLPTGEQKETNYRWPTIGNDKAIAFLDKSLKSGQLAHAYIFIGPEDLGKSTIALAFARNIQGEVGGFNSDLYNLEPEPGKKVISIDQVREFIKMLNLSSFLNSYKVGLIKEADALSEEAKSALLKTLEEPKDKVVIILLATAEENLPATILSRAQKVYFYPVPAGTIYDYLIDNYQANRSEAKDLANLALGKPLKALYYLENPELYKDYLKKASIFLKFFNINVSERLGELDGLFNDRTYSRQAVEGARRLVLMVEGLLRDLLLLTFNHKNYLQHIALITDLEKTLASLGSETEDKVGFLLSRLKLTAQAQEYLDANVNPRLIIEQLVINL